MGVLSAIIGGLVILAILTWLIELYQSWQRKRHARTLESSVPGTSTAQGEGVVRETPELRRRRIESAAKEAREKQQELLRQKAEEAKRIEDERLRIEREEREQKRQEYLEKEAQKQEGHALARHKQQEIISETSEQKRREEQERIIAAVREKELRRKQYLEEKAEKEERTEQGKQQAREKQQEDIQKKSKQSGGFIDRTSTTHSMVSSRLEEDRRIKEEQDREYEMSLQMDKLKLQQEEEKKEQDKENEIRKQKRLETFLSLPEEPSESADKVTYLRFRLFDGTTFERRFLSTDRLQSVFDYVEGKAADVLGAEYRMVSHFPHRTHVDPSLTLEDAGLYPRTQLFIEEL